MPHCYVGVHGRGFPVAHSLDHGVEVLEAAATHPDPQVLRLVLGSHRLEGCSPAERAAVAAAGAGLVASLELLLRHGCPMGVAATVAAARGGHRAAVEWLVGRLGRRRALGGAVFGAAVEAGDVELLRLLRCWGCPGPELAVPALAEGRVAAAVVEWLEGNGYRELVRKVDGA